jgi:hypothetical protein
LHPELEGERGKSKSKVPSLEATLAGIRRWTERRQQDDPDARVVKGRIAAEIAGYLGPDATGQILQPVTESARLFPAIEPVLSIFLGCRAAKRLIQRVIDTAIVRI